MFPALPLGMLRQFLYSHRMNAYLNPLHNKTLRINCNSSEQEPFKGDTHIRCNHSHPFTEDLDLKAAYSQRKLH